MKHLRRIAGACILTVRAWWSGNLYAWRIEFSPGRFRWRTRARMFTPWWLLDRGLFDKPDEDCGSHDWYNEDDTTARCSHCQVGERPWPEVKQEWRQSR